MELILIIELCHVALKEEKRLKVVPNLWVRPMLAENVSRVEDPIKMMHFDELGGNGFTNSMKGQGIMMLVQVGQSTYEAASRNARSL